MRRVVSKLIPFIIVSLVVFFTFSSCKKQRFLTEGANLSFSVDTLKFDTVFTSIGSFTNSFKIYNNDDRPVKINSIKLLNGSASVFRMNVDGVPTKDIQDIELAGNDSIYVFVAVTIDPTTGTLPFLVEEKIQVTLNEKQYQIPLEAYGQDAHYIVDSVLTSNTWINDKPYVIIHSALVDSGEILTIQKGCRIYMHQDSKLYVAGTLRAFGTKKDSIIFQGDRLDRSYFGYRDFPGEWGGLVFTRSSVLNNLNYCVIKNAGNNTGAGYPSAIHVSKANEYMIAPMLEMNNCQVYNSSAYGIIGIAAQLRIANSLIHSCNLQCLALIEGGEYDFSYCTIANYGGIGINHAQEPVFAAINFREVSSNTYVGSNLKANFKNCIIYGSLDDEAAFNQLNTWTYDMTFDHCLLRRTGTFPTYVTRNNCLLNQDPQFKETGKNNFHPLTTSPVKNAGIFTQYYLLDLDGKTRSMTTPSIGCYEVD